MKYLLIWCFFFGFANAHAYLKTSTPAEGETVTTLASVTLEFTESTQVLFSFFKVYKLSDSGDLSNETERLKLNGQASTLVQDVLPKRNDEAERADTGLTTKEKTSSTITLGLKQDLTPGIYVVMWRVLSVDTHVTQGFYLFEYAPS